MGDTINKIKKKLVTSWQNYRRTDKLATGVMNARYPGGWAQSPGNMTEKDYIAGQLRKGKFNVQDEKWVKKNHQ